MAKRPIPAPSNRTVAAPESFSRGRQYFCDGGVGEIVHLGEDVSAAVEVSEIDPYLVTIRRAPRITRPPKRELNDEPDGHNRQKCGEGAMQSAP